MTDKCGITEYCEMRTGDICTLGSPCPHQKPLTNEEWFCQLPTSEKAKVLSNATYSSVFNPDILILGKEAEQKKWEMWLKAPHDRECRLKEKHHD